LCGCAGTKQFSRYDEFDTVKIDQMSGNVVSGKVFGNTLLALNARRETRRITAVTNPVIVYLTNSIISTVTNQVITGVTNQSSTTATNTDFFPQFEYEPDGRCGTRSTRSGRNRSAHFTGGQPTLGLYQSERFQRQQPDCVTRQ
jgi:hypothetical protein